MWNSRAYLGSRRRAGIGFCIALLLFSLLATGSATAQQFTTPTTFSAAVGTSTNEAVEPEQQDPLEESRTYLEDAAYETGVDSLAIIVPDYATNRLDLYWKGDVPPVLMAAISEVRQRFEVIVHDAPYSWSEVDKEIRKILDLMKNDKRLSDIVGALMEPDISGITVLTADPATDTTAAESIIRDVIRPSMPIRFAYKTWATKVQPINGRWDDEPPFTAGAVITNGAGNCTTGFSVRNSSDTRRGIITAKHCGLNSAWFTASGLGFVGTSNLSISGRDAMGITWSRSDIAFPGFEGRTYVGTYLSISKRPIYSSSTPALDQRYSLSGGYSGSTYYNYVTHINYYNSSGGPNFITRNASNDWGVAGNGDSGGPAYYYYNDNVYAKGIIIALDGNRIYPCPGMPSSTSRQCSDTIIHVDFRQAILAAGLNTLVVR